jgi:hypothetical protein
MSGQAHSASTQRADNRRRMPQVMAVVDALRHAFGPDVRVTFAAEGGVTQGRRDTREYVHPVVWRSPAGKGRG